MICSLFSCSLIVSLGIKSFRSSTWITWAWAAIKISSESPPTIYHSSISNNILQEILINQIYIEITKYFESIAWKWILGKVCGVFSSPKKTNQPSNQSLWFYCSFIRFCVYYNTKFLMCLRSICIANFKLGLSRHLSWGAIVC